MANKKVDLGFVFAAIFCFPMGVYKLFFQQEQRYWSIIFGALLIILSIYSFYKIIAELIKNNKK